MSNLENKVYMAPVKKILLFTGGLLYFMGLRVWRVFVPKPKEPTFGEIMQNYMHIYSSELSVFAILFVSYLVIKITFAKTQTPSYKSRARVVDVGDDSDFQS